MKFRPLHDRVVVRRLEEDDKTAGGIIIPDTAKEKPQEGEIIDAGVIQLQKGTLLEGITTIDGIPAGQVKVVISIPAPASPAVPNAQPNTPEAMAQARRRLFSTKSLSNGDGHFVMLKRVPPGTYKITAARHSADNPFMTLLDMKQSSQELIIAPGQERAAVNFNLSSR